jgi:FkbM family methyltransferase
METIKAIRTVLLRFPFLRQALVLLLGERVLAKVRRWFFKNRAVSGPAPYEIQGQKMFLDPLDVLYLSVDGVHEPFMTEWVRNEIRKCDVVLDIGAHIGYYTLIFAKAVGEEGKVVAFEPTPENFAILKKNIELNGHKNVTAVQKAVSNVTGSALFYTSEDFPAVNSLRDSFGLKQSIRVETLRLDDYFTGLPERVDFIKMDIEGAEAAAFQGMKGLLARNPSVKIMAEFCPKYFALFGIDPRDFLGSLTREGFTICNIDEEKRQVVPVSTNELMARYTVRKKNWTSLFLKKGS